MSDSPVSPDAHLDPEAEQTDEMARRGSGDVQSNFQYPDPRTRGGLPQENIADRPTVSTVTPEDYPEADREKSKP